MPSVSSLCNEFLLLLSKQTWLSNLILTGAYTYCWLEIKLKKFIQPYTHPNPSANLEEMNILPSNKVVLTFYDKLEKQKKCKIYDYHAGELFTTTNFLLKKARPFLVVTLYDELTNVVEDITNLMMPFYVVGNKIDKEFLEYLTGKIWPISTVIRFLDNFIDYQEIHITKIIEFTDTPSAYCIHCREPTTPPLDIFGASGYEDN